MKYFFIKCSEHGHSKQLSLNHTAYMAEGIFIRTGTKKKSMIRRKSVRENYLPMRLLNASPRFITYSKYRGKCRIPYHVVHGSCQTLIFLGR